MYTTVVLPTKCGGPRRKPFYYRLNQFFFRIRRHNFSRVEIPGIRRSEMEGCWVDGVPHMFIPTLVCQTCLHIGSEEEGIIQ